MYFVASRHHTEPIGILKNNVVLTLPRLGSDVRFASPAPIFRDISATYNGSLHQAAFLATGRHGQSGSMRHPLSLLRHGEAELAAKRLGINRGRASRAAFERLSSTSTYRRRSDWGALRSTRSQSRRSSGVGRSSDKCFKSAVCPDDVVEDQVE